MAICELPGTLRTSKELSNIENSLMSSQNLDIQPSLLPVPANWLFTKHCHIKWWCLGKNTASTPCTPTPYPRWDVAVCHEMKSAWVKPYTLQQAFQILERTKHFGINTMYSLFFQIYKIYISSFLILFFLYIYMYS